MFLNSKFIYNFVQTCTLIFSLFSSGTLQVLMFVCSSISELRFQDVVILVYCHFCHIIEHCISYIIGGRVGIFVRYPIPTSMHHNERRIEQGSKGIRQWPLNLCTSPMIMDKITPSVDQNYWFKRLNIQLFEPTNQNSFKSPKLISQRIRNFKTLGLV